MGTILILLALITLFALAMGSVVWVVMASRQRRVVVRRVMGVPAEEQAVARPVGAPFKRLLDDLTARIPAQLGFGEISTARLMHAGFTAPSAAAVFSLARVLSLAFFPITSLLLAPDTDPVLAAAMLTIGVAAGIMAPTLVLEQLVKARQARIWHAIPDALDLMVVCVEAGVALDAAMQRVSRELMSVHPILAVELLGMSRRLAAGMPREQAMDGLYQRTGVEELRSLATHMVQSERWGTSIAMVLRLYSEQLRHKRRVAAEKRAAVASTRMLVPLVLFIFPTLFIVLLGPALLRLQAQF